MFLASHRYGPFIGLALAAFLLLVGFPLDARLAGFAGLVALFWAYGPLVGRVPHLPLSLGSLQHLCLVIMWGSYGYGGLGSPFLPWLAVVPLLAFLYLLPNVRLWTLLLAMIAVSTAGLVFATRIAPPPVIEPGQLRWVALVSILGAAAYVSMMAVHFGHVLNSRDAIEREIAVHGDAAALLDSRADALRGLAASNNALLAGVKSRARDPLGRIAHSCERLQGERGDRRMAPADLRSIAEAARYLNDLVGDVDRYARLDAADVRREARDCDLETVLREAAEAARGWTRPVRVGVDAAQLPPLYTHRALLGEAVHQVLAHVAQTAAGAALKLEAALLPSAEGGHVVIDVSRVADRAQGPDGIGLVQPAPPRSASGGNLKLALARRILSILGGRLVAHPGHDGGSHLRIELPVRLPA